MAGTYHLILLPLFSLLSTSSGRAFMLLVIQGPIVAVSFSPFLQQAIEQRVLSLATRRDITSHQLLPLFHAMPPYRSQLTISPA